MPTGQMKKIDDGRAKRAQQSMMEGINDAAPASLYDPNEKFASMFKMLHRESRFSAPMYQPGAEVRSEASQLACSRPSSPRVVQLHGVQPLILSPTPLSARV